MDAGSKSALSDPMTGPSCSPLLVSQPPDPFAAVSLV
jgi:hypothetical protein